MNKVIKFPETFDQACKRIHKKYECQNARYEFEIQRANWFAAGFLAGTLIAFTVGCVCYYFFGLK